MSGESPVTGPESRSPRNFAIICDSLFSAAYWLNKPDRPSIQVAEHDEFGTIETFFVEIGQDEYVRLSRIGIHDTPHVAEKADGSPFVVEYMITCRSGEGLSEPDVLFVDSDGEVMIGESQKRPDGEWLDELANLLNEDNILCGI